MNATNEPTPGAAQRRGPGDDAVGRPLDTMKSSPPEAAPRLRFSAGHDVKLPSGSHDHEPLELGMADLVDRLADPKIGPKGSAGYYLSALFAPGKRTKDALEGSPALIACDLDAGDWTAPKIREAIPGVAFVCHTTASHRPESPRWRVVVPLACELDAESWGLLARAIARRFTLPDGTRPDACSERIAQPIYWPTIAAEGDPFEVDGSLEAPWIGGEFAEKLIEQERARDAEEAAQAAAEREARAEARRHREARYGTAQGSVIDAWNAAHRIEETLDRFGYEPSRTQGGRWRSPNSVSGGPPAVKVWPDEGRFHSWHDGDAGTAVEHGDAFDLFAHFEHGGDFSAAVRAGAAELGLDTRQAAGSGGIGGGSHRIQESSPPVFEPLAALEPDRLPSFPGECLGPLADYTLDLAEAKQVPLDMAAPIVLGFAAGAVNRKAVADLGSHHEELALYVVVSSPPGSRKSAAQAAASEPIEGRERWLFENGKAERRESEARARHITGRLSALDKRAAKTEDRDEQDALAREAATLQEELEAAQVAARAPRLIASDTTPEKLAQMMQTSGERLLLASGEGALIFDRTGRYAKDGEPSLDLLLSSWSGEPVRIDRVTGEPVRMVRPCLGVVASIQPDVFRVLGKTESFMGRGLLDRFIWSVPPDIRGYRDARASRAIDPRREFEYRRILEGLCDLPNPPDRPILLRVEGPAREAWLDLAQRFETGQRAGGDLEDLHGWASKAPAQAARIAGVMALARAAALGEEPAIDAALIEDAGRIVEWASHHARRALGLIDGSVATGDARLDRVVRWLRRRPQPEADFTKRELWQGTKGGKFRVASDLDAPLGRLVDAGWIARRPLPSDAAGRPSEVWACNPEALPDEK